MYLVIALDSALQKVKHEDHTNYMHPLRICLEHKVKEKVKHEDHTNYMHPLRIWNIRRRRKKGKTVEIY